MTGWQWHQLNHMQVICIMLQTDNHDSTSSLNFLMGQILFLLSNRQCYSTEGRLRYVNVWLAQIAKIREDVDYYISSCCESDFEENEELYDDLRLEEASAALGSRLAAMNHDADDHSSDVSSEAPSIQNSTESVSPSPSVTHSKVLHQSLSYILGL